MYYYLCISSELTRFFRLVSVFRRIARFWTCNFSWSCHMISGRKLLYTKLQWIVLKEHSDWLLKFRKSFAIYLWATRAGFIVIVAGTNKAKSSFCAPLPIFLGYAVLKQLLTSASAARGGYLLRSFVAREISTTTTSPRNNRGLISQTHLQCVWDYLETDVFWSDLYNLLPRSPLRKCKGRM